MDMPSSSAALRRTATADAALLALATAVPPHRIDQAAVRDSARAYFGARTGIFEHLEPVFANARIETRYACQPFEWYLQPHGFEEKTAVYTENAVALGRAAAEEALAAVQLSPGDIDAIVCVSSTGVMTPSLDARLMNLMDFRPDTIRLPIFGYGCAGGVLGLSRAADLARSRPGLRVLLIVVELCSTAIRHDRWAPSNIVSTALFGDGAVAAVIAGPPGDRETADAIATLGVAGEHTWRDALDIMGWRVDGIGFDVIFHSSIPTLIAERYPDALARFLAANGLSLADVNRVCAHPGGVKVIEALEDVFGYGRGALDAERAVLRDYGNMSAPTVLFVLERLIRDRQRGDVLLSSLGPGFTAAFQLMRLS
jgi:alkylresorcinol/alkylpyrone synthase